MVIVLQLSASRCEQTNLISTDCSKVLDRDRPKKKKKAVKRNLMISTELEILVRTMKAGSTGNCQCLF